MNAYTLKGRIHALRASNSTLAAMTLSACYETVAHAAGCRDWNTLLAELESLGNERIEDALVSLGSTATHSGVLPTSRIHVFESRRAPTPSPNPPPKSADAFHVVRIEGQYFWAFASPRTGHLFIDNGFGQGHIGDVGAVFQYRDRKWSLCKYGKSEPRINLALLSPDGVRTFAHEFGLTMIPYGEVGYNLWMSWRATFEASPAFASLIAWGRRHPRKLAQCIENPCPYARNWAGRVKNIIASEHAPEGEKPRPRRDSSNATRPLPD